MIYIVTPVFNRIDFTKNYLAALSEQTVKDFKVIIVDDGSTDGTSEMIEKEFPDVILLKEEGDLWWAEATNIGVHYAMDQEADYIMTLNDDTLPEPDYIEKMIYWSEKKPDALLGALAIDSISNDIVYGGQWFHWKSHRYENIIDKLVREDKKGLHAVNTFPGRGLLIPSKVYRDIGFYDSKNFPQTYADIDFTARADSRGYKIYCNYDAVIKIFPDESSGVKIRQEKSWKNYFKHLFSRRGAGNLKWFIIYTVKNTPKKYLLQNLFSGVGRRLGGFLQDWIKEIKVNGRHEVNN